MSRVLIQSTSVGHLDFVPTSFYQITVHISQKKDVMSTHLKHFSKALQRSTQNVSFYAELEKELPSNTPPLQVL